VKNPWGSIRTKPWVKAPQLCFLHAHEVNPPYRPIRGNPLHLWGCIKNLHYLLVCKEEFGMTRTCKKTIRRLGGRLWMKKKRGFERHLQRRWGANISEDRKDEGVLIRWGYLPGQGSLQHEGLQNAESTYEYEEEAGLSHLASMGKFQHWLEGKVSRSFKVKVKAVTKARRRT